MLPAPAQGAIGIETLADSPALALVHAIDCPTTSICIHTERALLAALDASCHSPVGALARREGDGITLAAELLTEDGSEHVTGVIAGEDGPTLAANWRPTCSPVRPLRSDICSGDDTSYRRPAAGTGKQRDR